jgi:AhpD family alkylhydroperoxidase
MRAARPDKEAPVTRVPYLAREDLDPAEQQAFDRILGGRGEVHSIYAQLLHSPELAARVSETGDYLLGRGGSNSVTANLVTRETVVLAVARETNCQYEWTIHEDKAREAGVRDVVVEGIKVRSKRGLLPQESILIDFAKQTMHGKLNDPTFDALEHLYGRRGTVEITILIGFTALICYCLTAFSPELPEGMSPLLPDA